MTVEVVEVTPPGGFCRHCDVFTGFGGAGVARIPPGHENDMEWLAAHCWICKRSTEEITESERVRNGRIQPVRAVSRTD